MNVAFGVFAKHPAHSDWMRRRMDDAIAYGHEVFPHARETHRRRDMSRGSIYNASIMSAWRVPTWYEQGTEVLSFSAPPVPLEGSVEPTAYRRAIWRTVGSDKGLAQLQPNYFGCRLSVDGFSAWSDTIGLGRCYVVDSTRVMAVSNHIGMLAFFVDGPLTLDEVSWRRFAAFGWFVEDRTGVEEIRRISPATRLSVDPDGAARWDSYTDYDALARRRDEPADFDAAREQLATVTRNASSMLVERPIVQLSGGTDSRLTAAAWLSPGNPAMVRTKGTLSDEAIVAQELMRRLGESRDLEAQEVNHDVMDPAPPRPGEGVKPIDERQRDAMRIYDGDYIPSCVKANVSATGGSSRITIGGGGGEIAHAQYYPTQAALDSLCERQAGMDPVAGRAPWTNCTEATQAALREHLESEEQYARRLGRSDPSALDLFYLRQRFRRWVVAGHQTTSMVLFAAPAFIRMAFDLSPQDRVNRVAHRRLTEMFVPQWKDVPYYKPAPTDLQQITDKGLRLWQQKHSADYLFDLVASGGRWADYLQRSRVDSMASLARSGDAGNAHEQWFFRVLWIEGFQAHLNELGSRIARSSERL